MNNEKIQAILKIQEIFHFKTLEELDMFIDNVKADELILLALDTPQREKAFWKSVLEMSEENLKIFNYKI